MQFARFFIHRPVFASVIAILMVLIGSLGLITLPISQYPDITPPTVAVTANYPGASAETIAQTVATPLEQEINGVDRMLYIQSSCTSDGQMNMTVTFEPGTNTDLAQVLVQNRVAIAQSKLPDIVKQNGVTIRKRSPDFTLAVQIVSPDRSRNDLYLSNYALLQVRDRLVRVPGVGDVLFFGARDYSIRVWLDPERIAGLNMTAPDVVTSLREQNLQIAAGQTGAPPAPPGVDYQYIVSAQGRLNSVEEFENIVLKTGENGQLVRLKDVARVELGAKDYNVISKLNGEPAVTIAIFQAPGSNSLEVALNVRAAMDELRVNFPPGVDYRVFYDTTRFVRESIFAVAETVLEAFLLVALVVLVFLQNWRASLIPIIAVPVSLIGTFAVMKLLGFSLNNLTLFGMVLAIGIVVDDAIVVVENIEHHLSEGLSPREATLKAMDEVSGPIIAISLVLSAVFIPTAFIPGITGSFYRQFALTIAISTIFSAINSLSLSPALGALFLQSPTARKDWLGRLLDSLLGWFFRLFNRTFDVGRRGYLTVVRKSAQAWFIVLALYGGLLFLTWDTLQRTPTGFIPQQDQGFMFVNVELPDAASLARTEQVMRRVDAILKSTPGIEHTITRVGSSSVSGATASNVGTIIAVLAPFEERIKSKELSLDGILQALQPKFSGIPEARVLAFGPPAVRGLGSTFGVRMMVQDRSAGPPANLEKAVSSLIGQAKEEPAFSRTFSLWRANTPQMYLNIDRLAAKSKGVSISDLSQTLQYYMGSVYVNDVTLFGKPFQVTAQADAAYRANPQDILKLKTRNAAGEMVPLGSVLQLKEFNAPDRVIRFNLYPAADVTANVAAGYSSGQAIAAMERLANASLPANYSFEWTDMAYQEKKAGNNAMYVFILCVFVVFLVLAAQYENWSLPLAIILIVPLCVLSGLVGIQIADGDNNIFTQIGFVVLIGLACKNSILIVEFAKQIQDREGKSPVEAVLHACQLRLRPILMTSFAFIMGVLPLVIAKGAGAEMRRSLGVAVFSGMLGVTLLGLFLTPVFYVVIQKLRRRRSDKGSSGPGPAVATNQGRSVKVEAIESVTRTS